MGLAERLEPIIAPLVVGLGYEVWRIEWNAGRRTLQVMAERSDGAGMTVEDCAAISQALSPALDVEGAIAGGYILEVSSPGLDRPLVKPEHFARYVGRDARVETTEPVEGRRRFRGRIAGCVENRLRLEVEGRVFEVPLVAVRRARLVPGEEDFGLEAGKDMEAGN